MNYFYFGTIRKMVGTFGTLFSDIKIKQKNNSGDIIRDYIVPLNYGPKNVWLEKLKQREREEKGQAKTAINLPRISFEMGQMAYANNRATTTHKNKRIKKSDNNLRDKVLSQVSEIPYDFTFSVTVYAKNMDDGLQIVEQILPNFKPDKSLIIEELPELNICNDISVNLIGVTPNDSYEGSMANLRRVLSWEFTFTVKGYIYPPLQDAKLIKEVKNIFKDYDSNETLSQIDVTVSPEDAEIDDDWKAVVNNTFKNE